MRDIKTFKDVWEACWTGYKQVGMKKKNGKNVPNCVPEETSFEIVAGFPDIDLIESSIISSLCGVMDKASAS